MENTVARFEFRIFGDNFNAVEKMMAEKYIPGPLKDSAEVYILSRNTDTSNCKIRFDLLDIKQLISRQDDLEQWIPKIKVTFPVSTEILQYEIFKYLEVEKPKFRHPEYNFDLFMDEIVEVHPDLTIVNVIKKRQGFTMDTCSMEVAHIEINGKPQMTVGIESLNVDEIQAYRKVLGLSSYENENYVQALKRLSVIM